MKRIIALFTLAIVVSMLVKTPAMAMGSRAECIQDTKNIIVRVAGMKNFGEFISSGFGKNWGSDWGYAVKNSCPR